MSEIVYLPWSEESFLEGAKIAYDYDMKHSYRRYVGWFFIALSQFGVVAAIRGHSVGLLLISTILLIYWYALRWSLRRWMLRRFFAREESANKSLSVRLKDEGLCIDEACLPWESFRRAIFDPKGYLLELAGGSFIYLPRHIFPNIEVQNSFAATIRKKVPSVVRSEDKPSASLK